MHAILIDDAVCLFFLEFIVSTSVSTTRLTLYEVMTPLGLGGGSHLRMTEVAVISFIETSGGTGTGPGAT